MAKQNKPAIRFKGFTDAWEQRKFDEAFIERRDKTEKENEDILLSCAINGMFLNSELFGHFRGTTTIGYLRVKKNDLILSAQNLHLGNANVNLRFEHGIISPAYKVYDLNNCNPEFVQSWVKRDDTKNFFLAATTEGASQCRKNIEWETLGKQTISMPSLDEQKRVGSFFSQLDHLITLHQRKFDKLQVLKKAMLEKMFPKNGSSVPEIRFKGFTDAWEQRKVSEVAEICAGGTPSTGIEKYWHPKEIPWLSSGEVHKKYITYTDNKISVEGLNNSSARMIPANSVLIALAGQGKTRGTVAINRISLTTNQSIAAMIFSKEIVPEFVFCNLENRYEEIRRMSSGDGSRGGLNKQIVGEIEIPYTSKEEQAKIGAYFSKFDYLITLHQRELEKLQNIKKSMLEKMFV